MRNERKRKVIDIEPDKSYFYLDNETWEYTPIGELREIKLKGKISRKQIYFMKFYTQQGILSKIQSIAGSDSQYLLTLSDCIFDENNLIVMDKFESLVGLAQTNYYALLKRLRDKAIIAKQWKSWYVNPYFVWYGKDISEEVCKLFQEKTAMLYWITEL